MAKSRIEGMDPLIQSTIGSSPSVEKLAEELTRVLFEVPVSLKKEMTIHCAMNGITLRDFMTRAIKKELK